MRRALASATIAGALACVPLTATAAQADRAVTSSVLAQSEADTEPLDEDGDDDTGKYGLIGLSGLFGLFGYKKYREHRTARAHTAADPDGGTSRRV